MTTEIELKYLLLAAETAATEINIAEKITQILTKDNYAFKIEQKQLSNFYLDTADLALRQLDMGLRVRGIQHDGQAIRYEQTIKTAGEVIGGLHKRPEYNVDIDDEQVKLALFPNNIWQDSSANIVSLQQDIVRLFNTHFKRITWTISIGDSVIELAFDQGTISCDNFNETDVIYEIELELVSGEQESLFVLAKLLLANLAMRPGRLSKAARGYALAAQRTQVKTTQTKHEQNKNNNLTSVKAGLAQEELLLEIIPMQEQHTVNAAFHYGVDFCLTKLQCNIDDFIYNQALSSLLKIDELLALIRQGFWLFEDELSAQQLKIRDELSYFIRSLSWLDNAQHVQGLVNLNSSYRKKLAGSEKLITKLEREKESFPAMQEMVALFHSERFNLLQLSLLELLLSEKSKSVSQTLKQVPLIDFAKAKLMLALDKISNKMLSINMLPHHEACANYIDVHGLLVRSLLTGSWFSALFNKSGDEQQTVNYRRPWLDIKQGIGELQSLNKLQQQLLDLQYSDKKLLAWLDNKVENLIQAMEQSRVKALSIKPYWQ